MIFCPKNFVGNSKFYGDVLNILTRNYTLLPGSLGSLFVPNPSNIIDDRYVQMKNDYCKKGTVLERPYLLSSLSPFGVTGSALNVGHDLPIWYSPCDEPEETIIYPECDETENCIFTDERLKGKRIMIVGLEPMRKNQNPCWITLSTPWGLHNRDYRSGKRIKKNGSHLIKSSTSSGNQAKWMYIFVKSLLRNGASVYLTDAYKLFFNHNINSTSPATLNPSQISLFIQIIDKEIQLFRPDLIFALGKSNGIRLSAILSKHTNKMVVLNHINTRGWTNQDRCKYYKDNLINELNNLYKTATNLGNIIR